LILGKGKKGKGNFKFLHGRDRAHPLRSPERKKIPGKSKREGDRIPVDLRADAMERKLYSSWAWGGSATEGRKKGKGTRFLPFIEIARQFSNGRGGGKKREKEFRG